MHIELRNWLPDDRFAIVDLLNNYKIWLQVRDTLPFPYTLADADQFLEKIKSIAPSVSFAVTAGGSLAGNAAIIVKEDVYRRTAEIGYIIGEKFSGQGIATVVVNRLMQTIDQQFPDIIRTEAHVFEGNYASMRVLVKNGFQLEAVLRKAVFKNGKLLDEWIFSRFTDR